MREKRAKRLGTLVALAAVLGLLLAACGATPEPEIIEKEVVVTKEVEKTVEVVVTQEV